MGLLGETWMRVGERSLRRAVEALEATSRLSPAGLAAHQTTRLAALVRSAYDGSPSWRVRIDEAGGPDHVANLTGLRDLPLMNKEDLARPDAVIGDRTALIKRTTGGTTGTPAEVWIDPASNLYQLADHVRCGRWLGLSPGDAHALIWGVPPEHSGYTSPRGRFKALARARLVVPVQSLAPETIRTWHRALRVWRPRYLAGFPSGLARLGGLLRESGLDLRVPVSVAWAEQVFDHQRTAVRRAFGGDLYDRYGCNEVTTITHQCRCQGHHVMADRLIVEILRDGRAAAPGELGEVVVTDLCSFAMPLIRYRMGDLARAAAGPCRCGLGLPLIAAIEGRRRDAMAGVDRDVVLPREWVALGPPDAAPGFAVHQDEAGELRCLLLPEADSRDLRDRVAAFAEARIGVTPRFESVPALPRTMTGKIRYVRSDRPPDLAVEEEG